MTKKKFWEDPYQTTLLTTVNKVEQNEISLVATIFFAFSGGQESDAGSINGHVVQAARKEGANIIYTLSDGHGLRMGQEVEIHIDWSRRSRLLRLHFAAELVLELFYQSLPDVGKAGAHIAVDKARIDFVWPQSVAPLLPGYMQKAQEIIDANLEIICAFEDEVRERRYWEITGFSRVPCGGTHVKRTGELGQIRLKRHNIGRGKERVEIYLVP